MEAVLSSTLRIRGPALGPVRTTGDCAYRAARPGRGDLDRRRVRARAGKRTPRPREHHRTGAASIDVTSGADPTRGWPAAAGSTSTRSWSTASFAASCSTCGCSPQSSTVTATTRPVCRAYATLFGRDSIIAALLVERTDAIDSRRRESDVCRGSDLPPHLARDRFARPRTSSIGGSRRLGAARARS